MATPYLVVGTKTVPRMDFKTGQIRNCNGPENEVMRGYLQCRQISNTWVPTLAKPNSSAICSLNKPIHPLDERRPILRVSWVP